MTAGDHEGGLWHSTDNNTDIMEKNSNIPPPSRHSHVLKFLFGDQQ